MGKVSTRKRGKTWQYYFQLASVNETRKWKTGSGYRTKAEAQAAGTKALAEYNSTGIAFKVSEQSVADYFDYWMEHYVEQELAETTVNTYRKGSVFILNLILVLTNLKMYREKPYETFWPSYTELV